MVTVPVSTCANAGLLTGYPDGTFKPNQSITRAEFAAVAARFLSDEYTGENVGASSALPVLAFAHAASRFFQSLAGRTSVQCSVTPNSSRS